jgi:hypothetical protein
MEWWGLLNRMEDTILVTKINEWNHAAVTTKDGQMERKSDK